MSMRKALSSRTNMDLVEDLKTSLFASDPRCAGSRGENPPKKFPLLNRARRDSTRDASFFVPAIRNLSYHPKSRFPSDEECKNCKRIDETIRKNTGPQISAR